VRLQDAFTALEVYVNTHKENTDLLETEELTKAQQMLEQVKEKI
jgi:hypothetical protein